jgi:hypothetical protein
MSSRSCYWLDSKRVGGMTIREVYTFGKIFALIGLLEICRHYLDQIESAIIKLCFNDD